MFWQVGIQILDKIHNWRRQVIYLSTELTDAFQSTWGAFQHVAVQSHCLLVLTCMQFNLPQVGGGWAVFMYHLCFLVFQSQNWNSLDHWQLVCWIIHLWADRAQTCGHFPWQRSQRLLLLNPHAQSWSKISCHCLMSIGFFCLKWKSIMTTVGYMPTTSGTHSVPLI